MFVVFIFNLFSIFYLFNKIHSINYKTNTPSDYSIFFHNLNGIYKNFLNEKEIIRKEANELNNNNIEFITESQRRLGYNINENIEETEQFKKFLKIHLLKGEKKKDYEIHEIILCYKLKNLMELLNELGEKEEIIEKIKNDPKIIKLNQDNENNEVNENNENNKDNEYNENKENNENNEDKKENKNNPHNENIQNNKDNKNYKINKRKFFETFLCFKKEGESLEKLKKDKKDLKVNILEIYKNKKNISDSFSGSAIVTFKYIKNKELYLKNIPTNCFKYFVRFIKNIFYILSSCCINRSKEKIDEIKKHLTYEAAPEPEDIIFENLETTLLARIMKTALFFLISIIICFISFIIVASLNIFQEYLDENYAEHNYILYFVSIFISLVLDLIDFALETVLEILTDKERQATRTNFFLSFSIKLTVSSSLNSILVPFLCEIIFTKSKRYEVLIGNLFVEFLFNSFATPFLNEF